MIIDDETVAALVAILKDHRDCLQDPAFPMTCGREVVERLQRHGITSPYSAQEIDSKANLILQIDELIETLEKG